MNSAFECKTLESVKRTLNADSSKKIAAFYEPSSIKEFLASTKEEIREKIFSISNPSTFFEILNPLIELNSLYMTEKMLAKPLRLHKLSELNGQNRLAVVSMQSLIMLSEVIDDPELKMCYLTLFSWKRKLKQK